MNSMQSMAGPGVRDRYPAESLAGRVDIHHHILPPAYVRQLAALGIEGLAGQALRPWDEEQALGRMEACGIATAITSIPGLDLPGLSADESRLLARACNEYAAELGERHPGRFGSFACVPQTDMEQACREVAYALDGLKADGVMLQSSAAGRFLGDAFFEPLMAELDRRQARVFVHGNVHPTSLTLGLPAPGFLLEVPCDLTRAALNLIISGTLERYPGIRWILANGGGFLPYVSWRVSLANAMPEFGEAAPQGIVHYLQRFHYDTAQACAPYAMAALRELVRPAQLLYGSDMPFASPARVKAEGRELAQLPAPLQAQLLRGSALSLFPRFARPGETPAPLQPQEAELPFDRLLRRASLPLRQALQRLRK